MNSIQIRANKNLCNLLLRAQAINDDSDNFTARDLGELYNVGAATLRAIKLSGYFLPAGPSKRDGVKWNKRKKRLNYNNVHEVAHKILKLANTIHKNYGKSPYIPLT